MGGRKGSPPRKKDDAPEALTIRQALAKAAVLTGRELDESAALASMQRNQAYYSEQGAVEPPYDPESLLNYVELTPHLSPCIAAYEQNIEGYGYQWQVIEPWMSDLDSEEASDAIRLALEIERLADEEDAALAEEQEQDAEKQEDGEGDGEPVDEDEDEITDQDVDDVRERLKMQLRREQFKFDSFFKNCCSTMSFTKLRRITRGDIESNGWGAWELIYDPYRRLKRLNYIPGYTIRPLKDEGEMVECIEDDPVTPLSEGRETLLRRRFRRYVQIVQSRKAFFKSPGDPRVISRTTGKIYKSVQEMRRPVEDGGEGKDAKEANELIYIAQHDPRTPCPPPRWIGNLLAVLGVREADETNYFYLSSHAIPPGILFVAGGKVDRNTKDRLEQKMTKEVGGSDKNHKILVVEAKPMQFKNEERTMLPTMHFESLGDSRQGDATFTNYDERSADRIGASFRLPPMLRGYTPKNLNRATAVAALSFAEQQVFEPEREDIDWIINKYLLPRINVKLLTFRSNSPPTRSPEEIAELVRVAAPTGGLLPAEIRTLIGDALNRALTKVDEEWVNWPMPMTLAGMGDGATTAGTVDDGDVTTTAEIMAHMKQLQTRVESVIASELRSVGVEADLSSHWLDSPSGVPDDDESDE